MFRKGTSQVWVSVTVIGRGMGVCYCAPPGWRFFIHSNQYPIFGGGDDNKSRGPVWWLASNVNHDRSWALYKSPPSATTTTSSSSSPITLARHTNVHINHHTLRKTWELQLPPSPTWTRSPRTRQHCLLLARKINRTHNTHMRLARYLIVSLSLSHSLSPSLSPTLHTVPAVEAEYSVCRGFIMTPLPACTTATISCQGIFPVSEHSRTSARHMSRLGLDLPCPLGMIPLLGRKLHRVSSWSFLRCISFNADIRTI